MDPRLIPPGTLPPPNTATPVQVFLSLMFYLLNYNNSNTSPLTFTPPSSSSSSNSTTSPYAQARYRLLLREARYEGLSRWLGATNTSGIDKEGWLNSTYFPETTSNSSTAIKVTPFELQDPGEFPLLTRDALGAMMDRNRNQVERVYTQNLTGFVKGDWNMRNYTFEQLGLNETWTVESTRLRRIVQDEETLTNSTSPLLVNSTILETRQLSDNKSSSTSLDNKTLSLLNSTIPNNSTYETITTTYNRTQLRGSFLYSHEVSTWPNKALFNLREVQTSATGPILTPFISSSSSNEDENEMDDSKLLEMRPEGDWQDWEKKGPVTYLGGELTMSIEEGEYQGVQTSLDIEAAHLLSSGLLYGYATPSFIRSHLVETVSLPFFANTSSTTPSQYRDSNLTAQAIGRSMLKEVGRRLEHDVGRLNETIAEQERNDSGGGGGDTSSGGSDDGYDTTTSQCIFRFYGSLSPLPPYYTPSLYREFYSSLFKPTGSSLPPPPTQTLHYILSSTNCGLILQGQGTFLPTPLLWTRTKDFALLLGLGQLVLVVGLVRHLEKVATRPGTVVNVASLSIGVGCIVDAYVFVLLLTAGVVTSTTRSSLPLFLPSFLALLSSLLFGMRYVSMIRAATPLPIHTHTPPSVPIPAPPPPTREELAARAAEARVGGGANGRDEAGEEEEGTTFLPTTTNTIPTPSTTVVNDEGYGWNLVPTSEKVVLGLMLLALVGSIAIVMRWGWIAWMMLVVYSYWIPQIILNVQRGTARQSLTTEFIVGTTFARLILPVYFYGYSDNILDVDVSPWVYVLILYSSLQALILVLQSRPSLGARFFISQRNLDLLNLPQVHSWDYHQPLSESKLVDIEASLREEGNSEDTGPTCSICMDTVSIRATKPEIDQLGSVLANERVRQAYALTPCGHLLHTQCLQEWMNVRAICPECRKSLPSLS
ncbi:hypothetical protein JCM16303_004168 [Sporobolomyces ruberrimus]